MRGNEATDLLNKLSRVQIKEDKLGKIEFQDCTEYEITHPD